MEEKLTAADRRRTLSAPRRGTRERFARAFARSDIGRPTAARLLCQPVVVYSLIEPNQGACGQAAAPFAQDT